MAARRANRRIETRWRPLGALARCERGSTLPEFALALPVILLLIAGLLGLGQGLHSYSVMREAVRNGARFYARQPTDAASATQVVKTQIAALTGVAGATATASAAAGVCTVAATLAHPLPILAILGLPSPLTLTVRHNEPCIGE